MIFRDHLTFSLFLFEAFFQLIWVRCFAKFQYGVFFCLVVEVLRVFFFFFIESSFVSKSQYIVHVESLVVRSSLCYTHDVLIGSFSDMLFLL